LNPNRVWLTQSYMEEVNKVVGKIALTSSGLKKIKK
jgi:hypothetical protein